MIEKTYGNVIDIKSDLLINASNGKGWMGGIIGRFILLKGVAETIHYADSNIEKAAKKEARKRNVQCGDVFLTDSGKLDFPKGILHAVTMLKPGQLSNLNIIERCLNNILIFCEENDIKTTTIPLLGTGTGRVNREDVLNLYENLLQPSDTIFKVVQFKRAEGKD